MHRRIVLILTSLTLLFTAHDSFATPLNVLDDFNDGILTGWTVQQGSITESGGALSGSNFSLVTFDGGSGDSVTVDAFSFLPVTNLSAVAVLLGYATTDNNIYVKIQDNDRDGMFDRVFFYKGTLSPTTDPYFFDLTTPASSVRFSVERSGSTITAFVDDDFDMAPEDTFQVTGFDTTGLGSGIGLGFLDEGQADNFAVPSIPEPTTALLLACVLVGLGVRRRLH